MKFDANGVRRRREHRIREISEKIENMNDDGLNDKKEQNQSTPHLTEVVPPKRIGRFRLQVYISLLFLVLIVALNKSDFEWWGVEARNFTEEVLSEDFNFAGVTAWIEQRFGQFPSLLPTVQLDKTKEVVPVLSPPLTGTIVESFSPALTGVIIETGVAEEVHPIGPGWVRAIENKRGMGVVVVIQHGDALESTYGFLGKVFVKKNDWVYPDTVIGAVDEQSLFLQIRDKKSFVDPLDVVPFE